MTKRSGIGLLKRADLVAVICEGSAEKAIMNILIENKLLVFKEILEDEVITTRNSKNFAMRHLEKDFEGENIIVLRVIDSLTENFILPKAHDDIEVVSAITAPEIEMLILINEGLDEIYHRKKKSKEKPSSFLKSQPKFKKHKVKSYEYVYKYFSHDIDSLVKVLKRYNTAYFKGSEDNHLSLYDLIQEQYQMKS